MTLDDYLQRHYRPATAKLYAFEIGHYLDRIGGEKAALQATYPDLARQLQKLRERYENPATVNRILFSIKCYYRYLVASGKRTDHPACGLKLRDEKRSDIQLQDLLDGDELAVLLEPRAERYRSLEIRNRVVLGLLVHQALTVREITRLTIDDIELENARIRVAADSRSQARTLALKADQILPLHEYLTDVRPALNHGNHPELILTQRGNPERGEGIHYLVETLRDRVPYKRLTPTVIRQSVIAQKLKTMGLRQVQAFAGHRKTSTTEQYRQTDLEELRRAVERFHPLGCPAR